MPRAVPHCASHSRTRASFCSSDGGHAIDRREGGEELGCGASPVRGARRGPGRPARSTCRSASRRSRAAATAVGLGREHEQPVEGQRVAVERAVVDGAADVFEGLQRLGGPQFGAKADGQALRADHVGEDQLLQAEVVTPPQAGRRVRSSRAGPGGGSGRASRSVCRLGASRAATWRESENASTFRPRSGANSVAGCGPGGWTSSWRVISAWNGWSPFVWWSCTDDRPKPAISPHMPQGLNSPSPSALVLVVIVVPA